MRRKASDTAKIRILAASAVVLAMFNALVWSSVLTYQAPVPVAAPESVETPVSIESPSGPPPAATLGVGLPVRLSIPSISLDAAIERVALTKGGSMDVPKHAEDTGWYELGPRPGETGSAAIAGHVDWYNGATAVFADLNKVRPGDSLTVRDDKGAVISFVVRETKRFDPAADATDVFTSHDGKAHLNIITCDGVWDKNAKQYSKRLVVFADKVAE